ncbi:MAG: phenylalanine--tRNA ligase subunit beta [Candidatus Sungbacteria bacterium]|nr:phenylalanine--tRNA ligase subunit beta [Candidatus Sungbacteria bacterium]
MKFSYNWLKELVPFKESPEALAEFLTMRAFEVESIEKKGGDTVLDIKLLPNRVSDASGHLGMAREIAALKNFKVQNPKSKQISKSKIQTKNLLQVTIENPDDCLRYTGRVMTDIAVGPSPKWLRERLKTCGLQSINNIVDAANYVMLETGQPLHAFDLDRLNNGRPGRKNIAVRRAKKGEQIETLDKKMYALTPDILLITDGDTPLAIAGIKGGMASGITERTRTIVLESANFDPMRARIASQTLLLKTDASYRFEHGMDPNETMAAVNRLAELIRQLAGGNIAGGAVDAYPKKVIARKILFSVSGANCLLGTDLDRAFYQKAFARIGCTVAPKSGDALFVTPPIIRRDLAIPEDLIEEAGRILGYENIAPRLPELTAIPARRNDERHWEDRVRDYAVGAGFIESMLYAFTSDRELGQFFVDPVTAPELENPLSPETRYLVPRVLIKYATSAVENLRNFDAVKIFGVGKSFRNASKEKKQKTTGVDERRDLIFVLASKGAAGEHEFYEMKGVLDRLFETFGIADQWYDDALTTVEHVHAAKLFHPYRVAQIKIGDEQIGMMGEIHPAILDGLKSRARVVAAEINFDLLWKCAQDEVEFRPISKYPAVIRDIAAVVPESTKTETIQNVIERTAGELLIDTDLFDYFQDEEMRRAGIKNLAFHLTFQSPDRTLTDAEIEKLVTRVVSALEAQNWEVRK